MSLGCPVCREPLGPVQRAGIEIDVCPRCRGVWLDRGELQKLLDREAGRYPPGGDEDDSWDDDRRRYPGQHGHPPPQKKGFFGRMFDFD